MKNFSRKLQMIHSNVRDNIIESPEAEQAFFLSLLSSWAKRVAQDPLDLNFQKVEDGKNSSDVAAV